MKLTILLIMAVLVACFDYWAIQNRGNPRLCRDDLISAVKPRGWKQIAYFVAVPVALIGFALFSQKFYHAEFNFTMKRILVIGLLWPVAVSDYREFRIPNKLILTGLVVRAVCLLPEAFMDGMGMLGALIDGVVAAVAMVVLCVVCMLISRGSMGMGDLKLLAVMGLYLGFEGMLYALFFSMLVAFISAVYLLLAKKKDRKDAIPFAPYILLGTITSLILSGT